MFKINGFLLIGLCTVSLSALAGFSLFVEPDDGYAPVLNQINQAKKSIDMAMYLLKDRRIIKALQAAAKRGVKLRVILEKTPYGNHRNIAITTRKKLETAGIKVQWSDPSFFALTHEKAFTVDNKNLTIMTLNQTYSAYHFNREYGATSINQSDIQDFETIFNGDWQHQYPKTNDNNLIWSPNNATCQLVTLIQSAKKNLSIESEMLNNKMIENLLIQKAAAGVEIKMILPPQRYKDSQNHVANGGIKVRILNKDHHHLYMHAKLIIADDKAAYIGSENLSNYSLQMNRELGTLIYPAKALKRLQNVFMTDWHNAIPLTKTTR
jgi:cardiolipin synthase A/B